MKQHAIETDFLIEYPIFGKLISDSAMYMLHR